MALLRGVLAMPADSPIPPRRAGLDRIEIILFVFGVACFALLMLIFGQPLAGQLYLPVIALWLVGGVGFVWWFDRYLARRAAGADDHQRVNQRASRASKRRR